MDSSNLDPIAFIAQLEEMQTDATAVAAGRVQAAAGVQLQQAAGKWATLALPIDHPGLLRRSVTV